MEVDSLVKSILKKPETVIQNKDGRKVSFSSTVRLFLSDKNTINAGDNPRLKYVEINIIDKSSDKKSDINLSTPAFDDCKAEDFLVHKVIYDDDIIPDDENDHDDIEHHALVFNGESKVPSDEAEQNDTVDNRIGEHLDCVDHDNEISHKPTIFNLQPDDELDFVVHKVTELENDALEFVVHKVSQDENESSFVNELNEPKNHLIPADSNADSDMTGNCHKVSILTDFDLVSVTKPVSELSIENILEHDKIIAYNDQNSLSNSSIVDAMSNVLMLDKLIDYRNKGKDDSSMPEVSTAENVILSPPLQELSLEKIVRAHTNNILCELDISPLNSVQESDSDSDISSEDTMIMMTSEECQKNEQHIRQSFLEYQYIKESKLLDGNTVQNTADSIQEDQDEVKIEMSAHKSKPIQNNFVKSLIDQSINNFSISSNEIAVNQTQSDMLVQQADWKLSHETNYSRATKHNPEAGKHNLEAGKHNLEASKLNHDANNHNYEAIKQYHANIKHTPEVVNHNYESIKHDNQQIKHWPTHKTENKHQPLNGFRTSHFSDKGLYSNVNYDSSSVNGFKPAFRTSGNSSSYWDKTLSNVEIPKDVREWKITPSSATTRNTHSRLTGEHQQHNSNQTCASETLTFSALDTLPQISKSDELEHFVNESTERVERIRKRYHISDETQLKLGVTQPSPVRGIRPRFGSTAEILQLMQKQNQSSLLHYDSTRTHMSWPFGDNGCQSHINSHKKEPKSAEHFFVDQRQNSDFSSHSSFNSTYQGEVIHSNICDHYSILSCPLPGERGVPEGASPPRSLVEHYGDEDYSNQDHSSDNVVYYSMKV